LEIVDVGCNLKQFDGLTCLTLTPRILWQIFATGIRTKHDGTLQTEKQHKT